MAATGAGKRHGGAHACLFAFSCLSCVCVCGMRCGGGGVCELGSGEGNFLGGRGWERRAQKTKHVSENGSSSICLFVSLFVCFNQGKLEMPIPVWCCHSTTLHHVPYGRHSG